jgi:hypothetical protein
MCLEFYSTRQIDSHLQNQAKLFACACTWAVVITWKNTRHIEHKYFWVKEAIDNGSIEPIWVPTDDNVADLFKKHLDKTKFQGFSKFFVYQGE